MSTGISIHPLHDAWRHVKLICTDKRHVQYPQFGAKGVKLCEKWKDYEGFFEEMAISFKENAILARKDLTKGFDEKNCYWHTAENESQNESQKPSTAGFSVSILKQDLPPDFERKTSRTHNNPKPCNSLMNLRFLQVRLKPPPNCAACTVSNLRISSGQTRQSGCKEPGTAQNSGCTLRMC